jgi:hypothetical protein
MIATPALQDGPAIGPEASLLIQNREQHGSELANWNFDENSQLSQLVCSFHKDFDPLDG